MCHDTSSLQCVEMIGIIFDASFIRISSDQPRKNSSELRSCNFSFGIEVCYPLSHQAKLARELDVEFHFSTLRSDIIECTFFVSIRRESTECDSKIADHFCHMRSDECASHVRLLDSRHGRDAMSICSKICVIQFCRIMRSCYTSDRKCS